MPLISSHPLQIFLGLIWLQASVRTYAPHSRCPSRPHALTADFHHVSRSQVPETLQLPGSPPPPPPPLPPSPPLLYVGLLSVSEIPIEILLRRAMKMNSDGLFRSRWCALPPRPQHLRPQPTVFPYNFSLYRSSFLLVIGTYSLCPLFRHECCREGEDRRAVCLHNRGDPAIAAHRLRVCCLSAAASPLL